MDREIDAVAATAWQDAEHREARKRAEAMAGDVIAYHAALKGAGIDGDLLATQFNDAWCAGPGPADVESTIMLFGGED